MSTGALLDAAMGPFTGKGTSELGLLRQIEAAFCAGDVMLADAFYCNYFLIAALQRAVSMCCLHRTEHASPIFAAATDSGPAIIR